MPQSGEQKELKDRLARLEVVAEKFGLTADKMDVPGEYEDQDVHQDVYTTAFLLAKNATPGMYSFNPFKNPEIRLVWLVLFFIVGSTVFALLTITCLYPPTVADGSLLVNCADSAADPPTASYRRFLTLVEEQSAGNPVPPCEAFPVEMEACGSVLRRVDFHRYFYQNVFSCGEPAVCILQTICCTWVMCCVYYRVHEGLYALLAYYDFNEYFLPLKNEKVSNRWALALGFLQWLLSCFVVCVSCICICGYESASDVVLNSLAFTFIAEVSEYFNSPLVKYYSRTSIRTLEQGGRMNTEYYGTEPIMYLYPEYSAENYDPVGWYLLQHHKRPGMISDYTFRHDPSKYKRTSISVVWVFKVFFWLIPITCVAYCHTYVTKDYTFTAFE